MTVPSYEDLTPGIPDVIDAESVDQLALFLTNDLHRRPGGQEARRDLSRHPQASWSPDRLFACVRLQAADGDLSALLEVARDFSPRVRRVSEREVLLDVSGLGRLIGPPPEIARQLAQALGAAARMAIAPTQTMARLLAHAQTGHAATLRNKEHKADKDHEPQTNDLCDLCDRRGLCAGACGGGPWPLLAVDLLRELETLPPGINDRDRARPYETLERWGIATLGELAALPSAELSSRLGRRGVALQRLARGLDAAPFVPDGETPRYIARLELEWPLDTLEPLSFVFARLLEPLAASLERADRAAAAVRLDLRLTDRSTHARVLQLPAPLRDPRVLRTLLLLDLESHPPSAATDVVAIELDPAPSRIIQFSLLQRALPSPETLSTLTARLSALAGESRVGSPVLVDSHRPDAFAMTRYAPEGAKGAEGANGAKGAGANGGKGANGAVLRRERRSVALQVSVARGRPVHIAASRRGIPYGAIVEAAGPWRASGGWWATSGAGGCGLGQGAEQQPGAGDSGLTSGAEQQPGAGGAWFTSGAGQQPGAGGWNRDEWDVALKSGAVCRVYQDRKTQNWFFEGLYD